ncbi:putative ferric-chelate reductase 1 [Labeo rohita]|uniref:putative ferric-chelate reductase 1 n=1 Tax=Labeo rohita TaxID=84645 RepID=UPI0021E21B97|nr:putative ferric-chelate reductase 1 [Labeo rohita]
MESKLIFLVVCVIGCAVSGIKADGNLSTRANLTSNITRNECGKTKLCLDIPKGCDPSGSSQCFFTSVQINATTPSLMLELSGNSNGYIALAAGTTSNVSQGLNIVFVCGNNSGSFFLQTAIFSKTLVPTNVPNVNSIQGSIQPNLVQCVFSVPIDLNTITFLNTVSGTNINISNIANSKVNVFLDIMEGSTNGTVLGEPRSVLGSSALVNLANVTSTNVVSTTASTTTSTTVNSNACISLTSLLSHATICLLSIFLHLM